MTKGIYCFLSYDLRVGTSRDLSYIENCYDVVFIKWIYTTINSCVTSIIMTGHDLSKNILKNMFHF
jgi:hypothetical protein